MSHKLNRAALTALLMIALPSWASDLPTSENPATGKWTRMRPTSFSPTLRSAIEQCNRTAAVDAKDRLTPEKCVRFEELLRGSECRKVLVIDGVVFDFMNGRESGQSRVTRHVAKQIGRPDVALLCDLGDRVHAYWFMGDQGRSCNNVGIVFEASPTVRVDPPAPKPADPPPPPPPTAKVEEECPMMEWIESIPPPPTYVNVPPLAVSVCGHYIMMPGGTWQIRNNTIYGSTTMRRVCPNR